MTVVLSVSNIQNKWITIQVVQYSRLPSEIIIKLFPSKHNEKTCWHSLLICVMIVTWVSFIDDNFVYFPYSYSYIKQTIVTQKVIIFYMFYRIKVSCYDWLSKEVNHKNIDWFFIQFKHVSMWIVQYQGNLWGALFSAIQVSFVFNV